MIAGFNSADPVTEVGTGSWWLSLRAGRWVALGVLGLAWLILFAGAVWFYEGSAAIYVLFSAVFLALLVSAFYRPCSYVYAFIALLLWLGFWNKLSWKLWGVIGFPEPTGRFIGTSANWDEVLLVATVAAFAVLFARILWIRLGACSTLDDGRQYPAWLARTNRWGLMLFVVTTLGLVWVNVHYGLAIIGFEVRTLLPWPLNALVSLMLMGGGGLTIWAAVMIWWQAMAGRPVFFYVVVYFTCSALVAVGSLSRASVLSYSLPFLVALYVNRRRLIDFSRIRFAMLLIWFGAMLAASFFMINQFRSALYFSEEPKTDQHAVVETTAPLQLAHYVRRFLTFSVARWVGIEGVMAVSAYPDKSLALLREATLEPRRAGVTGLYQQVAPFPEDERIKPGVVLSSIPGGVGFLYYAGSLPVVFVLTLLISLLLQSVEAGIHRVTGNPLLCASSGFLMAMLFVHQWGMPYYVIPFMGFVLACAALVALLQSRKLLCVLGLDGRQGGRA